MYVQFTSVSRGLEPNFQYINSPEAEFFYSNKGFRENVISELLKVVIENNDTSFNSFSVYSGKLLI